jgi:hypothetical protein
VAIICAVDQDCGRQAGVRLQKHRTLRPCRDAKTIRLHGMGLVRYGDGVATSDRHWAFPTTFYVGLYHEQTRRCSSSLLVGYKGPNDGYALRFRKAVYRMDTSGYGTISASATQ